MKAKTDEAIKANIFGLTVACPYTGDNPTDCPLHDIRKNTHNDGPLFKSGRSHHFSSLKVNIL